MDYDRDPDDQIPRDDWSIYMFDTFDNAFEQQDADQRLTEATAEWFREQTFYALEKESDEQLLHKLDLTGDFYLSLEDRSDDDLVDYLEDERNAHSEIANPTSTTRPAASAKSRGGLLSHLRHLFRRSRRSRRSRRFRRRTHVNPELRKLASVICHHQHVLASFDVANVLAVCAFLAPALPGTAPAYVLAGCMLFTRIGLTEFCRRWGEP